MRLPRLVGADEWQDPRVDVVRRWLAYSPLRPFATLFRSRRGVLVRCLAASAPALTALFEALWAAARRELLGLPAAAPSASKSRSEEHTSELPSHSELVSRLLLEKQARHAPAASDSLVRAR